MSLQLQQTDTAAVDGAIAACSVVFAVAATPGNKTATGGGTPGVTPVSVTFAAQSNNIASVMFEAAASELGVADWLAGSVTVRLNITTGFTANSQWVATYACRLNAAGASQETLGSLTGQTTDITTTGVKSHTFNINAASSPSAGDKPYFVLVFKSTAKTPRTGSFTPDQIIDTPFTSVIITPSGPSSRRQITIELTEVGRKGGKLY